MTAETARVVYSHNRCAAGCGGCRDGKPLNLAEREVITGRSLTQYDEASGVIFCVDCLAGLPALGYEVLAYEANFHVCGEEPQAERSTKEQPCAT